MLSYISARPRCSNVLTSSSSSIRNESLSLQVGGEGLNLQGCRSSVPHQSLIEPRLRAAGHAAVSSFARTFSRRWEHRRPCGFMWIFLLRTWSRTWKRTASSQLLGGFGCTNAAGCPQSSRILASGPPRDPPVTRLDAASETRTAVGSTGAPGPDQSESGCVVKSSG